ncbi:MAG TPA: peroxiredoxin [Gemmatimonadales bacterium]|nr:peroxiredoxin [Gemmatimonadales bacterium]
MAATSVQVGQAAPDFTAPMTGGGEFRLSDLKGKRAVVLYFYPKDETPGCTAEACAFRDSYEIFVDAGAEVVGVSGDTVESHERFAEHHELPFVLISDKGGAIRRLFGVKATLGIWPGRVTFVIDKDGLVRHVFASQTDSVRHVEEALRTITAVSS